MTLKYQKLRETISVLLIIINLRLTHLIQKQKQLVNESNISSLAKDSDLKPKTCNIRNIELKAEQDKIVKLQIHDLSNFRVKIFLIVMVFRISLLIKQRLKH